MDDKCVSISAFSCVNSNTLYCIVFTALIQEVFIKTMNDLHRTLRGLLRDFMEPFEDANSRPCKAL